MAHKDRKIHKKRGSRTCGWGGAQKHRGAGSRGGRGNAGSNKHKKSWFSKYAPDHFSREGFKRPKAVTREIKAINVGRIDEHIDEWVKSGYAKKGKDKKYVLGLTDLGYDKLLGSGRVTHPLAITVGACSESAKEKVEGAGGEVVIG